MKNLRPPSRLLACLAVMSIAPWAGAFDPATSARAPGVFGLVGLSRSEAARLNIVRLDPPSRLSPSCEILLMFVDETGAPIVDSDGARIAAEVLLGAGEAASLELHGADVIRHGGALRKGFRPVLVPGAPPANGEQDPCALIEPTLELYDAVNGRTVGLYVPNVRRIQPQVDLAALDVVLAGQTQDPQVATMTGIVRNISGIAFVGSQQVQLLMDTGPNTPPAVIASDTLTTLAPGADFHVTGLVARNMAQ